MMRSDMPTQMQTPNAPAGKGYNREGFKGRGPLVARQPRPDVTTMPVQERPALPAQAADMARTAVARRPFKKGGMVSTKGNGCCAKSKSCKMY